MDGGRGLTGFEQARLRTARRSHPHSGMNCPSPTTIARSAGPWGSLRRRCAGGLLLGLSIAGLGCRESSGPDDGGRSCTLAEFEAIVIDVSAGLEPVLDWTPGCRISQLVVEYSDEDIPGYTFTAWMRFARSIDPPVRYAEPGSSTFPDLFPPQPLVAGRTYTLRLFITPEPFGASLEMASRTFVP